MKPKFNNLIESLPDGWRLSGLSGKIVDGHSNFKIAEDFKISIEFTSTGRNFVQYKYQIFHTNSDITSRVYINNKKVTEFKSLANEYKSNIATGYSREGKNTIDLIYECDSDKCEDIKPQIYVSELAIATFSSSIKKAGISAEKWLLIGSDTPLTINGAGSLEFDGLSYVWPIKSGHVIIGWPTDTRIVSISLSLWFKGDTEVSLFVDDELVNKDVGYAKTSLSFDVSLVKYNHPKDLLIKIRCLDRIDECALLSSVQSVVFPRYWISKHQDIEIALTAICLIIQLGLFFNLIPLRPTR